MKDPMPINLMTSEEVRASGWQDLRDLAAAIVASPAPSASMGRVTAAKVLADWLGYSWDGLNDRGRDGYPDWAYDGTGRKRYQGGKEGLLRLVAALDSPPCGGEGELLATMATHLGWELDWGPREPNDEEGEYGWRVHDRRGNRSDLEWTLIGFGASPADALRAASLPTQESEDGR